MVVGEVVVVPRSRLLVEGAEGHLDQQEVPLEDQEDLEGVPLGDQEVGDR